MTGARIGSVFVKTTDMATATKLLGVLFRFTEPEPDAQWLEIPAEIPLFVQLVTPGEDLHAAEFGIRVDDAAAVREQLLTHGASDLFEVAPGVRGFHVRSEHVQELFIHE